MDEREKSRRIAEVFTQLSDENKTRLEDIALGMRIQKEIDEKTRTTDEADGVTLEEQPKVTA